MVLDGSPRKGSDRGRQLKTSPDIFRVIGEPDDLPPDPIFGMHMLLLPRSEPPEAEDNASETIDLCFTIHLVSVSLLRSISSDA